MLTIIAIALLFCSIQAAVRHFQGWKISKSMFEPTQERSHTCVSMKAAKSHFQTHLTGQSIRRHI